MAYLHRFAVTALTLLAALLTACASPYRPPVFVQGSAEFPGIGGLMSKGPVDVLLVHGMCTHEDKDAFAAMDEIHDAIERHVRALPPVRPLAAAKAVPEVRILRRNDKMAAGTVRFHALMWSDLTTPLKQQLAYDRTGDANDCSAVPAAQCKPIRARINAHFKDGLLNDCLADAMIYQDGNRRTMRDAIVAALTRTMQSLGDRDDPLVLVSASLGSKMTYDALLAMLDAPDGSPTRAAADRLNRRLALVYMQANQLPILGLADQDIGALAPAHAVAAAAVGSGPVAAASSPASHAGSPADALQLFLAKRNTLAGFTPIGALTIVAFTDPNDLLSYRLLSSRYDSDPRVRIADVLVSNAPTYLGLFENPLEAHQGYGINADVAKLIACGRPKSDRCR